MVRGLFDATLVLGTAAMGASACGGASSGTCPTCDGDDAAYDGGGDVSAMSDSNSIDATPVGCGMTGVAPVNGLYYPPAVLPSGSCTGAVPACVYEIDPCPCWQEFAGEETVNYEECDCVSGEWVCVDKYPGGSLCRPASDCADAASSASDARADGNAEAD